jgi:hypothetical protein
MVSIMRFRVLKSILSISGLVALTFLSQCGSDGGDEGPTCDELQNKAASEMIAALEGANHSCLDDSECVLVPIQTNCAGTCGGQEAISQSDVGSVESLLDQVDNSSCAAFAEKGCSRPPMPCVPYFGTVHAVCSSGQCVAE